MVRPRFTTTSGDIEAVGAGNRPGRTGLNSLSTKGWDWGFATAIHKVTWDNGTAGKGVF